MPFHIVRNDITKMKVDAIVNTANPLPEYGVGIDTAVYEAAGKEKLLAKRRNIGVVDSGNSFVTKFKFCDSSPCIRKLRISKGHSVKDCTYGNSIIHVR